LSSTTGGGTTTTVTVTVANRGSAKARQGSAHISLKIGGTSLKDKRKNAHNPFLPEEIDVNDDIDIEFTWMIPDGPKNYTINAVVDHPDDSESDNDRLHAYIRLHDHGDPFLDDNNSNLLIGTCSLFIVLIVISAVLIGRRRRTMPRKSEKGMKRIHHTSIKDQTQMVAVFRLYDLSPSPKHPSH
jgi:hypothetical protein